MSEMSSDSSLGEPPASDTELSNQRIAAPDADSDESAHSIDGPGVLLGLAFVAFVITYTLAGQHAAGIAFWIVMLGLPALYVVVAALGAAWTRGRRDELLQVATLAVNMSRQRPSDIDARFG